MRVQKQFVAARFLRLSLRFAAISLFAIASTVRADWASQFQMKQQIGDSPADTAVLSEPIPSEGTDLLLTVNTDEIGKTISFHAVADPGLIAEDSLGHPVVVSAEWIAASGAEQKKLHILCVDGRTAPQTAAIRMAELRATSAKSNAPWPMPVRTNTPLYSQPQFRRNLIRHAVLLPLACWIFLLP